MPYTYTTDQAIEFALLVTVIGREARGESDYRAKLGVGWSIRNRAMNPKWWGHDWISVICKPMQYTSMVPPMKIKDPNLTVYPELEGDAWRQVIEAAEGAFWGSEEDPTNGADHYFDRSLSDNPPAWATDPSSIHLCDIGNLLFYKAH